MVFNQFMTPKKEEGMYESKAVLHIQDQQGTEMTKVISTGVPQVHEHVIHITDIAPAKLRLPSCHLMERNKEARQKFFRVCVPLYKAALTGDWETARVIIEEDSSILTASITSGGHTVLHLAAGTDCVQFVDKLVGMMSREDLELQDQKGNTALCFAVAKGNVQVAEILLAKNKILATIRGGKGMTPLYLAVLFGHSEMARLLFPTTQENFDEKDRIGTFFTCIDTGIYDLALEILKLDMSLAVARDKDGKTALHLLAQTPSAFANKSSRGWSKHIKSCLNYLKLKRKYSKQSSALDLVRCLWEHVLTIGDHEYAMNLISHPSELVFDATKLGNFEFLAELINCYPDLVWATDSQNRSIVHVAVLHRHANIFNLIHDIGAIKDILATYEDDEENNILHLAAKLPPLERLNTVSGAALQMQQELLWFEEVKKIAQPLYVKEKNKKRQKPKEIFTRQHKTLLKEGERWMKDTANSCMIVSTLIATVVFAAAFSLPGGYDNDSGTPTNLQYTSFLIFVLSDGLALFSSVVAILMFLSILTSRYAENDFLKSLPLKLMIGLASLFFSMTTMMIAFSFTFVIAYHHYGYLKWVPFLISIFAFCPILLFAVLKFPLLFDTFSSTYWSRTLFKPHRHMLY